MLEPKHSCGFFLLSILVIEIHNNKYRKVVPEKGGGVIPMTKSSRVALKPLELVCIRNLKTYGDEDLGNPRIL